LRIILFLLVIPPMLAELLTGNAPPLRFFNPLMFTAFVLLYGCASLLIREFRARWKLGWRILFLGVAYAIVEEGLTTKAFFNPKWQGAGALAGYGMYLGVQWVWTLGVAFTHATLSSTIPVIMAEHLWPECRNALVLGKRGFGMPLSGLLMVTLLGMLTIGTAEGNRTIPFHPHPMLLTAAAASVIVLCWLAYRCRDLEISSTAVPLLPPGVFFLLAGLVEPFFLIVPNVMVARGASGESAILVELALIALALLFAFFQLCHRHVTRRHTTALILGFVMPWILLAPLHEFHRKFAHGRNGTGMLAVGVIALVALLLWRRAALNKVAQVGAE